MVHQHNHSYTENELSLLYRNYGNGHNGIIKHRHCWKVKLDRSLIYWCDADNKGSTSPQLHVCLFTSCVR
jgi:hypothetical protein